MWRRPGSFKQQRQYKATGHATWCCTSSSLGLMGASMRGCLVTDTVSVAVAGTAVPAVHAVDAHHGTSIDSGSDCAQSAADAMINHPSCQWQGCKATAPACHMVVAALFDSSASHTGPEHILSVTSFCHSCYRCFLGSLPGSIEYDLILVVQLTCGGLRFMCLS